MGRVALCEEALPLLERHFSAGPPCLRLRGLGTFGTGVLFAAPEPGADLDRLKSFVTKLNDCFSRRIGHSAADQKWEPHVTIAKTSRVRRSRLKLEPELCAEIPDALSNFGLYSLQTLELC